MSEVNILWADDEIDLLKPHIIFLEERGYTVTTVNSGADAIAQVKGNYFDIVFLDENMPGLSGLETLQVIKGEDPTLPVVMITKSEEEDIMEEAIGSKISDYLIKPVNPNQILMSLKKNLDQRRIRSEKATSGYQQQFREISMKLMDRLSMDEWFELYRKMTYWNLELENSSGSGMEEIFANQMMEANSQFSRFISQNYLSWLDGSAEAPVMSHTMFPKLVQPIVDQSKEAVFLVVIDNLRFDQWKVLQPRLAEIFRVESEDMYLSILPTATHYARNALFAGLMPLEIARRFPDLWKNEDDDGSKNMHEEDFLMAQLKRLGMDIKTSYQKILNLGAGKRLNDNFSNLLTNKLNVIVYNFVDMLSHARTEMEVIKELADDESAYRSITQSWFDHSPLWEIIQKIAESGSRLIITTDHGTVRVEEPVKVVGDKNTNSNLRYKVGRNLNYNPKDVFEVKNPEDAQLPKLNVSTSFIFARERGYFVYPNNYNHFVKFYGDTFQHGGISIEEMMIPFVSMRPK
jgi:CheY-like chemotaxis protein